ncbi:MAG: ArsA family ATPase [Candidatus Helarchaeota archaeon]
MKKIIILSGKGGVGKSTISCATAVRLATLDPDAKVLICSFDIAHNLSDMFGKEIGDKITKLTDEYNLYAIEPNPDHYIHEYTDTIFKLAKQTIFDLVVTRLSPTIRKMVDSMLLAENMPMQAKTAAFFQIFLSAGAQEYDYLISDFPPTGATINLFEVPVFFIDNLLKNFMGYKSAIVVGYEGVRRLLNPTKILDGRSPLNDMFTELRRIQKAGDTVHEMLQKYLSLRLVAIPEKAAVNETLRALIDLKKYYEPNAVYINKIISENTIQGNSFLKGKREEQLIRIGELKEKVPNKKIFEIELKMNEPINIDGLKKISQDIYKDMTLEEILNPTP